MDSSSIETSFVTISASSSFDEQVPGRIETVSPPEKKIKFVLDPNAAVFVPGASAATATGTALAAVVARVASATAAALADLITPVAIATASAPATLAVPVVAIATAPSRLVAPDATKSETALSDLVALDETGSATSSFAVIAVDAKGTSSAPATLFAQAAASEIAARTASYIASVATSATATAPAALVTPPATAATTTPITAPAPVTATPLGTPTSTAAPSTSTTSTNEWELGFEHLYDEQWIDSDKVLARINRTRRAAVESQLDRGFGGYVEPDFVRVDVMMEKAHEDYLKHMEEFEGDMEREFEQAERDEAPPSGFVRRFSRRVRNKMDNGKTFLKGGHPLKVLSYMLY